MTPELYEYLRSWLTWAESGALEGKPVHLYSGRLRAHLLASNAQKFRVDFPVELREHIVEQHGVARQQAHARARHHWHLAGRHSHPHRRRA